MTLWDPMNRSRPGLPVHHQLPESTQTQVHGVGDAIQPSHPAAAAAKLLQSCLTLCHPIDGSPPGSPIRGILQARTLEWGCHFLLQCMKVKSESVVTQSCLTLSDPIDRSLPGSSIHGIFQGRVLEWVPLPSPHLILVSYNWKAVMCSI